MNSDLHIFRARPRESMIIFPAIVMIDYLATNFARKEFGDRINRIIYALREEDIVIIAETNKQFKRIGDNFVDKFLKERDYLKNLIKWSEGNINMISDSIKKNFPISEIENLSNNEIAQRYKKFVDTYEEFSITNIPCWWLGADSTEIRILEHLKKISNDPSDILSKLLDAPEYKTENNREELSLLKIAQKIKDSELSKVNSIKSLPTNINGMLKRHTEEFSSIPFGYNSGIVWDEGYFLNKINLILKKGKEPKAIIKEQEENEKDRIAKRNKFEKSLNLPKDILYLIKCLRQLAYLQELKKTNQTRSHPWLENNAKPLIAERLKIPRDYLDYLTSEEITSSLKKENVDTKLKEEIELRKKPCVLFSAEKKITWLYGKEAEDYMKNNDLLIDTKNVTEIKGQTACKGKVIGTVKVCNNSNESDKVKKGDILVTFMTTPDFVPAMKRSAAVLTDEGGITCHAAIASRELGIPCIIGTKNATKVLKDGDLIEVDADNGIIKILERK